MGKLIFVTGGSRSGKSSYGLEIAKSNSMDKLFIATCIPEDEEMRKRVLLHQQSRPSSWNTIEVNEELVSVLSKETAKDLVIVLDCLTLFVSARLINGDDEKLIRHKVEEIVNIIKNGRSTVIIISNEVGMGLIPDNKLGREFRDIAGFCNQIVAAGSEEVYFMVSGIPMKIKG